MARLPLSKFTLLAALLPLPLAFGVTSAEATNLSGYVNVDDAFTLYISADDSVAGTPLLSGTFWPTTYVLAPTLLAGKTLYLHIVGMDGGPPAGVLGTFALSDAGYAFSNGSQTLVTNTTDWVVRKDGFADTNETPMTLGYNGVSPWGWMPLQSGAAQWIWRTESPACTDCSRYFSTTITAVPEPESWALLAAGLAGVGVALRRRRG